MKTLKTLATGIVVVGLMSVTSARASFTIVGGTALSGSWDQQWSESGVGNFNSIDIAWVSGTLLEPPALRTFSDASWSASTGTSTTDSASGNALTSLTFYTYFVGNPSSPTTIDLYAYDGSVLVDSARASWTGGTQGEWDVSSIPVPEASTLLTGALLLLPLGASTLRILRRNRMA